MQVWLKLRMAWGDTVELEDGSLITFYTLYTHSQLVQRCLDLISRTKARSFTCDKDIVKSPISDLLRANPWRLH